MLNVNIERLEACLSDSERMLRGGLLSMDLWDADSGLSLAGYNSQPAASALFNQLTRDLQATLSDSGFPALHRYYLLDVADGKIVVVLRQADDFLGGLLLDAEKTNLGILVGVVVPKALQAMSDSRLG